MIQKVTFGSPIKTHAVIYETECICLKDFPETGRFHISEAGRNLSCEMDRDDLVYGLGEQVRGMNKRGWKYVSDCSDDPNHTEGKQSLYAADNFLMVCGNETTAIFINTPEKVSFDIGYSQYNRIVIQVERADYECYIITAESPGEAVRSFRKMIGTSYIPPKWAFGYGQSRWGYRNEADIRETVERHRKQGIPLDMVYLDIDYMEQYQDFTVDKNAFPDFPAFVREMKEKNIRLIPIIDAGIKVKEGYFVYDECIKNQYYCTKENDEPFFAAVWPGKVIFPDFLNQKVRKWFGQLYKILLDQGIEGFWNDMNEPAIFYSQEHLQEVFQKIEEYKGVNLDIRTFFEFKDLVGKMDNRQEDYASFYHQYEGKKICHNKVHNLYGYYMTKAASDAFDELEPEKRILMFSRSSSVGMHRYGGVWTGDNRSWWSHLKLSLQQMPSLNMCGFLYCGSDIGGFGDDVTPDLLLRWLEFAIFTPLMRNHSADGTRKQEVFRFPEFLPEYRNVIELRYVFLPYLYSEYMKAALGGEMYFQPLSFVYPKDKRAGEVEDQLMIGDSVMIAPVYEQNGQGRYVYLPEEMKLYRFRSRTDFDTEVLAAGDHYVSLRLHELAVFIRPEHVVPVSAGGSNIKEAAVSEIRLLHFIREKAQYRWYDDDGETKNYRRWKNEVSITAFPDGTIMTDQHDMKQMVLI